MKKDRIGIVGPCAAGKTTLVEGLSRHGIEARHIAQEHSYVADMWHRLSKPDLLIYIDVSFNNSLARRKMNWTQKEYDEQVRRLENARQNADYYLDTNGLTQEDVLEKVLDFLYSVKDRS